MDNVTKIFSGRLKQLRGTKSQDEVAKSIGISRGALSYYEKGERNPDINTLFSIAKYYGVSADYLLGLSDVSTLSIKEKAICDTTGLSQKSVEILEIRAQKAQLNPTEDNENDLEALMWSYLSLQAINIIIGDPDLLGNIAAYFFTTFTHYTDFYSSDIYHPISDLELFDAKLGTSYSDDYDFLSDAILLRIQKRFTGIREKFIQSQTNYTENEETSPEIVYSTMKSLLDSLINKL